jgi:hypothetical protein
MPTPADYMRYARETRELAEKMTNANDRKALEMLARAWERVAKEAEAKEK